MQNLPYSRTFNFEKNTLQSHSHNLAALSGWMYMFNEDLSHNQCLNILAMAYGYKSFASLNEKLKLNQKNLEPLQPVQVYLDRLNKADLSNILKIDTQVIRDYGQKFLFLIASYIVDCKLDLNNLHKASSLKGLKLSAESTSVSTLYNSNASFIDYAILNTLVSATYDHGLPEQITLDKRIKELYKAQGSNYVSSNDRTGIKFMLFDPVLITDIGSGQCSVKISSHDRYLYNRLMGGVPYPKTLTSLQNGIYDQFSFPPPKCMTNINQDTLRKFVAKKDYISIITVHQNDFGFNHDQINGIIEQTLDFPISTINNIGLELFSTLLEKKSKKIGYAPDLNRIERIINDKQIEFSFESKASVQGKEYIFQGDIKLPIYIEYVIDCNGKPYATFENLNVLEDGTASCNMIVFDRDSELEQNMDDCLSIDVDFKLPKNLAFKDQITNLINQKVNCKAFELGCYYNILKNHVINYSESTC